MDYIPVYVQEMNRNQRYDKIPIVRRKTKAGSRDMVQYLSSGARLRQGTEIWYSTCRRVQDLGREQRYDTVPVVMCKTWAGNRDAIEYPASRTRHG